MSKEVKIAAIAIISGVILYFGFDFLKGSDFLTRTNYYYAVYNNIGSLAKSNPVKINGVPVGKVNRIRLLPNQANRVLVEFDVQEGVVLGDSTIAELTSDLLGGNSIVLRVGKVVTPKSPGDTLLSRIDKGLEEIIESAQPVANNLNITINRLNDLLAEFEGIGNQLQYNLKTFDTTLTTVNKLMTDNQAQVGQLLVNTNKLLENINDRVGQLEPILSKTNQMVDSLDATTIVYTLEELEGLMRNLNTVTEEIAAGNGSIGKMIYDDSLYVNLNKMLVDLDRLLIHFDQYPKDFLKPLGRKHEKLRGN